MRLVVEVEQCVPTDPTTWQWVIWNDDPKQYAAYEIDHSNRWFDSEAEAREWGEHALVAHKREMA